MTKTLILMVVVKLMWLHFYRVPKEPMPSTPRVGFHSAKSKVIPVNLLLLVFAFILCDMCLMRTVTVSQSRSAMTLISYILNFALSPHI